MLLCLVPALRLLAPAVSAQSPEPRIAGGSAASIEQYPWQAALVLSPAKASGDAHQRQFCGGSLITSSIVLTAAHCLYDDDPDCNPIGAVGCASPAIRAATGPSESTPMMWMSSLG